MTRAQAERVFNENIAIVYNRFRTYREWFDEREADDLLQELMLTFWRACLTWDADKGSIATWAYLLLHQRAVMLARERAHSPKTVGMPVDEDGQPLLAQRAADPETQAFARIAMRLLSPELAALALGYSQREIARAYGRNNMTIHRRIKRARSKLRSVVPV